MKWSSLVAILLPVLLLITALSVAFEKPKYHLNPSTDSNQPIQKIRLAFNSANIGTAVDYQARDYNQEIEYQIQIDDGHQFTAIFSTERDAYLQVTSLQKVLKIAKIKNKQLTFIDLSSQHPYATFKNN